MSVSQIVVSGVIAFTVARPIFLRKVLEVVASFRWELVAWTILATN